MSWLLYTDRTSTSLVSTAAHSCVDVNADLLGTAFRSCSRKLRRGHWFEVLQQRRRKEPGARRVNVPIPLRVLTVSKGSQWREERHSCALAE